MFAWMQINMIEATKWLNTNCINIEQMKFCRSWHFFRIRRFYWYEVSSFQMAEANSLWTFFLNPSWKIFHFDYNMDNFWLFTKIPDEKNCKWCIVCSVVLLFQMRITCHFSFYHFFFSLSPWYFFARRPRWHVKKKHIYLRKTTISQ